ncbi:hypothetical protein M5D96_000060 [Drosophila gunungcola]|uniref:Protein kinase domain-containing protein n=1 Tax=Drosophila gunungcola TaxID=103775 RepID=A0A9P9YVH1_9MUSC|nr:hypothetical protein M5D96_000060 [Drosophila gunungcola]
MDKESLKYIINNSDTIYDEHLKFQARRRLRDEIRRQLKNIELDQPKDNPVKELIEDEIVDAIKLPALLLQEIEKCFGIDVSEVDTSETVIPFIKTEIKRELCGSPITVNPLPSKEVIELLSSSDEEEDMDFDETEEEIVAQNKEQVSEAILKPDPTMDDVANRYRRQHSGSLQSRLHFISCVVTSAEHNSQSFSKIEVAKMQMNLKAADNRQSIEFLLREIVNVVNLQKQRRREQEEEQNVQPVAARETPTPPLEISPAVVKPQNPEPFPVGLPFLAHLSPGAYARLGGVTDKAEPLGQLGDMVAQNLVDIDRRLLENQNRQKSDLEMLSLELQSRKFLLINSMISRSQTSSVPVVNPRNSPPPSVTAQESTQEENAGKGGIARRTRSRLRRAVVVKLIPKRQEEPLDESIYDQMSESTPTAKVTQSRPNKPKVCVSANPTHQPLAIIPPLPPPPPPPEPICHMAEKMSGSFPTELLEYVIAAAEDGDIYMFHLVSHKLERKITKHSEAITNMSLCEKESILYTTSLDGFFKKSSLENLERVIETVYFKEPLQSIDICWGLAFIGSRWGLISTFNVVVIDKPLVSTGQSIIAIKATKEGVRKILVLGCKGNFVQMHDAGNGLLLRRVCIPEGLNVYSLLLNDGHIYCGTQKNEIYQLEFVTGNLINKLSCGNGAVSIVAYKKRYLLTGCYDGFIYVLDKVTGTQVGRFEGAGRLVLALAVAGDKKKRNCNMTTPVPRRTKDLVALGWASDSEDDFNTPYRPLRSRSAAEGEQKQQPVASIQIQARGKENEPHPQPTSLDMLPRRVSELTMMDSDSEEEDVKSNHNLNCAILNDSFVLSPSQELTNSNPAVPLKQSDSNLFNNMGINCNSQGSPSSKSEKQVAKKPAPTIQALSERRPLQATETPLRNEISSSSKPKQDADFVRTVGSSLAGKSRGVVSNDFRAQKVLFQTPMTVSRAAPVASDSTIFSLCDTISESPDIPEPPKADPPQSHHQSKRSLDNVFRDILKIKNHEYTISKKLGSGGSSLVYLARRSDSGEEYALKVVDLQADPQVVQGYLNETKLLAKLQGNVCVVALYDYQLVREESKLYMVMEKGDCDLNKILQSYTTNLPLYSLMNILYQMLQAVNYIHQHGVIHSDLKPANFLMALTDTSTGNSPMRGANQPKIKISTKSDVWSLGCILYLLLYQKTPFGHIRNIYAKMSAIATPGTSIEYPPIPPYYPVMLVHMAKNCLQLNPKKRPSCTELLQYPFHMVIPLQNLQIPSRAATSN